MSTTARLPARSRYSSWVFPRPHVLVDDVPEPGLRVRSVEWSGRVGRASATLVDTDGRQQVDRWSGRSIALVVPARLAGDDVYNLPLLVGRIQSNDSSERSSRADSGFLVSNTWSDRLQAKARHRWTLDASGAMIDASSGWLEIGVRSNRSAEQLVIGESKTYLPSTQQEAWSIEQAVGYLAAIHGFVTDIRDLPTRTRSAPIVDRIDLSATLATQLDHVLKPYGLWIRCVGHYTTGVAAQISIGDSTRATKIRIASPTNTAGPTSLLSMRQETPSTRSRHWIARGDSEVREGTFDLIGVWDDSLEAAPDTAFDRAQSTDFTVYANVFRRWVLNEDAAFDGAAFDLSKFFDRPIDPRPLPFRDCLTLDDTQEPRPPIVEFSIDAGINWLGFGGGVELLRDRAGVSLAMTTLPTGFVDAGRSGQLRVRVTAGLASPVPEDVTRWRGNPFFSPDAPEIFDLRSLYGTRVVDASSVHRTGIDAGTLEADEQQAAPLLDAWLVARLDRMAHSGSVSRGRATIVLRGWWWTLRPGDRLFAGGGRGLEPTGRHEAIDGRGAVVTRVRFFADSDRSTDGTTEFQLLT